MRLAESERKLLSQRAGELGLSAYVRRQLFGKQPRGRAPRQPTIAARDLAQVIGLLGSSEILTSLKGLGHAAKIGALPVTPETEALIGEACQAVLTMRSQLIEAIGLRGEP